MTQGICARFVGREQELKNIAEFLEADEPKGLSLLGLPQIGRSRLLCEIERRRDEYGASICVVRIECKESTNVIRWSDLLEAIAQRVCTRFGKRDAVSQLRSEYGRRVGGFQVKAMTQIFFSYAREDEEKVGSFYQELSDAGFKPWMDKKDILPGERWKSCIQTAIRRSDFFLACLSANSVNKRGFLQREIKDALDIWQEKLDDDIYLIPVRLEDCEVPANLRDFQWVNLFEEDGWTRLLKAIQVGMERRSAIGKTSPASTQDVLATPKAWRGFFEDLKTMAPELRVVFLLDDFDQCKPHERPQSESQAEWVTGWHFAKFVAYPNISLITMSTRHIQQVEDFFTYFTEQWLPPFTKEEMDTLVQANALRPSPRLKEAVWQWAGGFPGLACKLLERHHRASPKLARVARDTWLHNDVKPWLGEIWDFLHPFEQHLLKGLAHKPRFPGRRQRLQLRYEREEDVADWLEKKGLVSLDEEWAQLAFEALKVRILLLPEVAEKK